jgi:hypothetical protein
MSGGFDDSEPGRNAQLALAAGLLGGKGSFGSILGNSMLGAQDTYRSSKKDQQAAELNAAHLSEIKLRAEAEQRRIAAEQRALAAQEAFRGSLTSPQMQASQAALSGGGGPTVANAAQIPKTDPTQDLMYKAMQGGLMSPLDYVKMTQKDTAPIKLGKDDRLIAHGTTPGTFKELIGAAPTKEDATSDWKNYSRAVSQGYSKSFEQFLTEDANRKAPKVSVSVNSGQKGYDNESKLRNDFKSEPIYKDYSEMQTAHKQIKAGIASGTPIGDVTTATKIMKLLDPGSVVRESELAIAMAASGRMDRLKNYVQMQVTGEKLTPTQRVDFGKLADDLMEAAGQAYNKKRSEYAEFAKTYGLNDKALGAAHVSTGGGSVKWGDLPP